MCKSGFAAGYPQRAFANVIGNVNGNEFGVAHLYVNISRTGQGTRLNGELHEVPADVGTFSFSESQIQGASVMQGRLNICSSCRQIPVAPGVSAVPGLLDDRHRGGQSGQRIFCHQRALSQRSAGRVRHG